MISRKNDYNSSYISKFILLSSGDYQICFITYSVKIFFINTLMKRYRLPKKHALSFFKSYDCLAPRKVSLIMS